MIGDVTAPLRISMRLYFHVLCFGWQDFFEVLEKVLATAGEHLQLKDFALNLRLRCEVVWPEILPP